MTNEAAEYCLALAECSKQAMFSFDVEMNQFIYRNPAFNDYVNFAGDGLIKVDVDVLIHPEDLNIVKESYKQLLEENKKMMEFRIVMPDKMVKMIRIEAFMISTGGRKQVVSGIIEDITAFKEHNDTLNKFSNKKNSLLNILSHDLLGPLGTIQNLSVIVQKKAFDFDYKELNRFISSIEKISRRSIVLIRNLLSQEFIESAAAELVVRRTNLVVSLRDCIEQYGQSKEIIRRTFNFSTSSDTIMVDIDETKLMQVVNNLVSNSIKFTQEDGIIDISIMEEHDAVLITVSDNGIGIPEKHFDGLFDKFTSARRPGLHGEFSNGLGMSIIKTIVEWHHGKITFESRENVGTTFYIRLPYTK